MAGQLNPQLLLVVPLAPLAGSVIAGLFGTRFFGNKIGRAASHSVTILGVLIALRTPRSSSARVKENRDSSRASPVRIASPCASVYPACDRRPSDAVSVATVASGASSYPRG